MPDNLALKNQIRQLFADYLYIQIPSEDVDLIDGGLLDSLSLVDLLVRLETEFGMIVAMDELDLEDFRTIDRIANYVCRMVTAKDVNSSFFDEHQIKSK